MRAYSLFLSTLLIFIASNVSAAEDKNVELLASSCAACHGTRGHSVGGLPSLAGMDRLHIIEQMTQFSNGERPSTVMKHHASGYSANEIELLANFFSKQ